MTDHANPCQCGRPIQDTANLCPDCADTLRNNLHAIANRWAELEDALTWRDIVPGTIGVRHDGGNAAAGERKLALSTGTIVNERAVRARRAATDAVWFALQVIRDDCDNRGWAFTPPRLTGNRTQDQTPAVARWLAGWHIAHITHKTERESAEEIATDVAAAEKATYQATHPSGIHWAPVNLTCDQFATSDMGERVPCPGDMWALVGTANMPDLVCDHDEAHKIDPGVWERNGFKRRLQGTLNADGMARLASRITG